MSAPFYNTIGLTGEALKKAVTNATKLDEAVLLIYTNTRKPYSPSQIFKLIEKAGRNQPLTSCRRSITNLTTKGHLVKQSQKVMGLYGEEEHVWQVSTLKYPSATNLTQAKLFNS